MRSLIRAALGLGVLALLLLGGRQIYLKVQDAKSGPGKKGKGEKLPVTVEVAPIEVGPIRDVRVFSGTLEARSQVTIAAKVSGRIERLLVDLADAVKPGQLVAALEDDEFEQAVTQAEADLAVADANLARAQSELEIAARELERVRELSQRGMESEAQLDVARSEHLSSAAAVKVAAAQVVRAKAAVKTARIKHAYTEIRAIWASDEDASPQTPWVVSERHVSQGDTVSANAALVTLVELDPIMAVLFVTEKDYARLARDPQVKLTTEAYPGLEFVGTITRISPVFRQASRQARVELRVENPDQKLKPGMFVRSRVVLRRVAAARIVPEAALLKRGSGVGVFLVDASGTKVTWHEVRLGIREGSRVQILGGELSGRVVTLGHQLIDASSSITIPDTGKSAPVTSAR